MDVKPQFLTAAPRNGSGLADAKSFGLRSFDAGLVITPLSLQLTAGAITSGRLTQRVASVTGQAAGTLLLNVPEAEVAGTYFLLARQENRSLVTNRANIGTLNQLTATVPAATAGNISGFVAQRGNSRLGVAPDFFNGTLPAVTSFSRARSLQERVVTAPVCANVENLNVGGVQVVTGADGLVTPSPAGTYRGTLSSFATRTGVGVYSVQFRHNFTPGTVLVAVSPAATGSATAVLAAARNTITISTFAAGVAADVISGTIGLFWFAPLSQIGSRNQSKYLSGAATALARSFTNERDYPAVTNLQHAVVIPWQIELDGSGNIITTNGNTLIPRGMRIIRSGTTFTLEIGRCTFALGFALESATSRSYALLDTNLVSQGRLSFVATATSTVLTGYIIASGTP